MWSELTYLVERRCRAATSPQAAARSALAVYGALSNCEMAFERVENDGSLEEQVDAVLAMDVVLAVLHNLQPQLRLFDPEPAQELAAHVGDPHRSDYGRDPRGKLKMQVEVLRRLLALETAEEPIHIPTQTAFTGARRELARFIRDSYSLEELFP